MNLIICFWCWVDMLWGNWSSVMNILIMCIQQLSSWIRRDGQGQASPFSIHVDIHAADHQSVSTPFHPQGHHDRLSAAHSFLCSLLASMALFWWEEELFSQSHRTGSSTKSHCLELLDSCKHHLNPPPTAEDSHYPGFVIRRTESSAQSTCRS